MTLREHYDEIRRQILDENKQVWSIAEYGNDPDVFLTQCVAPLQMLQEQGCFQIKEIYSSVRGRKYISKVVIVTAINLDL